MVVVDYGIHRCLVFRSFFLIDFLNDTRGPFVFMLIFDGNPRPFLDMDL
jgi:hypothetical protein